VIKDLEGDDHNLKEEDHVKSVRIVGYLVEEIN
jgi:hypothetical protein